MKVVVFILLLIFNFAFAVSSYELTLNLKKHKEKVLVEGFAHVKLDKNAQLHIPHSIKILEKKDGFIRFKTYLPLEREIFISYDRLPQIDGLFIAKVTVKPLKGYRVVKPQTDKPVDSINIILNKDWQVKKLKVREDLTIYGYFLNKSHKKNLLKSTATYINYYEKLFGKFPYKVFSVVETYKPYGYSFPTFTTIFYFLTNKDFIYTSSLPHEILHQWFGCSVYVDYTSGNWAEGLTTFFADYNFAENKDTYRKLTLEKYEAYVDKDLPLKQFKYKKDRASEALGYGKGMFLFYTIKRKIGKENLIKALRNFYEENKFKIAGWKELQKAFKPYLDQSFFTDWLEKPYTPQISLKVEDLMYKDGYFNLKITLSQKQDFNIDLPVYIKTLEGHEKKEVSFSKKKQTFTLKTKSLPLQIYTDPYYKVFRRLDDEETDPLIHFILSKKNLIVADKATTVADVENKNVIFKNENHPVLKSLVKDFTPLSDRYIAVFKNPLGEKKVIAVEKNFSRYTHFGNYSAVYFKDGKLKKEQKVTFFQNPVKIAPNFEVVDVKNGVKNLNYLTDQIKNHRLIYIGENHTVFSNHYTQLYLIKEKFKTSPKLIIAMEMLQRPFQKVVDDYVNGNLSEVEFLKKVEYYKRWGYDYRLYRPIFEFAKENKIKIVALNIEKEITQKVSKCGLSCLSEEEKKKLPKQLDFSNLKYRQLLREIFKRHKTDKNFIYFYEAQILWDETMAQTLSEYMKKYPDYSFIVLAGNGHLRFRYAVPDRVERRTGEKGIVILNDDELRENIADVVVYPPDIKYEKSPKLGVLIEEKDGKVVVKKVLKGSIAEKLGIKENDIIHKLNGYKINSIYDLKTYLTFFKKGNYITVIRDGRQKVFYY